MKPGKCAGSDGLTAEVMHAWSEDTIRLLTACFLELIQNRAALGLKPGARSGVCSFPSCSRGIEFKDLRPIILLPVTQELYIRVLLYVSRPWISPREEWLLGCRAQYQPSELTRCVLGILEQTVEWFEEVHVVKTDLADTYERFSQPLLQTILQASVAPTQLIKSLLRCHTERKVSSVAPGIVCRERLWDRHRIPSRRPRVTCVVRFGAGTRSAPAVGRVEREQAGKSHWVRMVEHPCLR